MKQIIIKLIEFSLNLGLIPSQRDQMPQNLPCINKKRVQEYKTWRKIVIESRLIFKYYISKLGGGGLSLC